MNLKRKFGYIELKAITKVISWCVLGIWNFSTAAPSKTTERGGAAVYCLLKLILNESRVKCVLRIVFIWKCIQFKPGFLRGDGAPSAKWTPSGCCNRMGEKKINNNNNKNGQGKVDCVQSNWLPDT